MLDVTFEMPPEQVLDIFVNYLNKSPELQQRDVSELFISCLKENANKPNIPSTPVDKR